MDPLAGSPWSAPEMVAGFAKSPPNAALMTMAAALRQAGARNLLDIGCGAGRNAVPLAASGWRVLGVDLSLPMVLAANGRARDVPPPGRLDVAVGAMEHLPVGDGTIDLVVAHGIWNLARSGEQFRAAVREASRAAGAGAALFVFTFSRTTLSPEVQPVAGESFVYTQFSGDPQCFLTQSQLLQELADAGFSRDPGFPLAEYNRPRPGVLRASGGPVIYEGVFRRDP